MSYAGMGLAISGGFRPPVKAPTGPAAGPTTTMVDVGIPPDLVKVFGTWLWNLGSSMGTGDPARVYFIIVGGALKAPRLNAFGKVDPATVAKMLSQIPANLRVYSDNAPNSPKIAGFLADIAAGKYAGHPPTTTTTLHLSSGTSAYLPKFNASTLTPPVTPPVDAPPPVKETQPEVQCTDGYFRDVTGLCVPNAAPPGPATQPDISQTTPLPGDISEALPPWMAPGYTGPGGPVINGSGLTRTCPDGTVVHGAGVPCPAPTGTSSARWTQSAPLGVGLKWWVLGAAGLGIAAIAYRSSNKVTANRRHRRKKA